MVHGSKEIVRGSPGHVRLAAARGRVKLQESVLQVLVDFQNRGLVPAPVAIIWRAENCDDRGESLMSTPTMHLVAVNLDLMGADDGNEVVLPQNFLDWIILR